MALRTEKRKATAYHPQTNGLTERLNKTIADMLSTSDDHKNWEDVLLYVSFGYNTALQETIEYSPFRLLHGCEVTTTIYAMLLPDTRRTALRDADVFIEQAEETCQLVRLHIQCEQGYV